MKTIMFIMIMLTVLTLSAQKTKTNYYLATLIIEKCDAVITSEAEAAGGKSYDIHAEVSSYYDFDLFKMQVKSVCSEYSDVSTIFNWTLTDAGNYGKELQVGSEKLLIMYFPELKKVVFSCQYE